MRHDRPLLRLALSAAIAVAGMAALAGPAPAASTTSWSWSLAPLNLVENVPTNVSTTFTNGSSTIGCIVVKVPPGFSLAGVSIPTLPGGDAWTYSASGSLPSSGSSPAQVTFAARTLSDVLKSGEKAVFIVRVTALGSPLPAWNATAYEGLTTSGQRLGSAQSQPNPFKITVPATPPPAPTPIPTLPPTPAPTATATPTPAPAATATPTPAADATPTPTAGIQPTPPDATPAPTTAALTAPPSGTPSASPSSTPSASPSSSASASGSPEIFPAPIAIVTRGSPPPPVARESGVNLDIGGLPAGGTVHLDSQTVGGMGMFAWAVPVAFLGLPGLVLILIVLVQAGFAWFFVPVTNRVLGPGRRRPATARRSR